MMLRRTLKTFVLSCFVFTHFFYFTSALAQPESELFYNSSPNIITFGSCLRQWKAQPVWASINALQPQAFIFLGDNMYSDTGKYLLQTEPKRIGNAYQELRKSEEFQQFLSTAKKNNTAIFATWDDHDYGKNDAGEEYPHKLAAKKYFLDFFNLSKTAVGDVNKPGIYQSYRMRVAKLDVQLLLLDTRSFRSPLKKDKNDRQCPKTNTVANTDPTATVLGEEQWLWVEQELQQSADLRIIVSSIQVIPEQHCYEKWANFPQQRQKLFNLIQSTHANGVVFISGDRHLAEISKYSDHENTYPLYEITASGLNSAMGINNGFSSEANDYRLGNVMFEDNFGAISINQNANEETELKLQIYSADGQLAKEEIVYLNELVFN